MPAILKGSTDPGHADEPQGTQARLIDWLLLSPVNWILFLYAGLALAGLWAYVGLLIQADRQQVMQAERNRLAGIAAVLETVTVTMFNDGVGAAVAGANDIASRGGARGISDAQRTAILDKMLTGGQYVRGLFIVQDGRFIRSGRGGIHESSATTPSWLTMSRQSPAADTWVGRPIPNPDLADEMVVPVARRAYPSGGGAIWAGGLFDFAADDAFGGRIGRTIENAGVVTTDGIVLIAIPWRSQARLPIGLSLGSSPLLARIPRPQSAGLIEGYAPRFGKNMIYAYELVQDYPIRVLAGNTEEQALAAWRARRVARLGICAGISVAVLLLTKLLMDVQATRRGRQRAAGMRLIRLQQQSSAIVRLSSCRGEYQAVFRDLCREALDILATGHVSIWLLEDNGGVLHCVEQGNRGAAQPAIDTRVSAACVSRILDALRKERVIGAGDPATGTVLQEFAADALPAAHLQSLVAAAIRTPGELVGMSVVGEDALHRRWEPDEVSFVAALADQAAQALGASQRERILEDLRVLAGELIRTQDDERRRIGRELHDSTSQGLAALEMSLGRLIRTDEMPSEKRHGLLEECAQLAHQCSTEIRTASYLLHPPLLDELGLISALRWLADGLHRRSNIEIKLELPAEIGRLRQHEELTLFRVAQEALTNVHRHSASPWVAVRLRSTAEFVELEIEDAGRGLTPAGSARQDLSRFSLGVGLAGMRERIFQIGGTFSVESSGEGTRVRARLQVNANLGLTA